MSEATQEGAAAKAVETATFINAQNPWPNLQSIAMEAATITEEDLASLGEESLPEPSEGQTALITEEFPEGAIFPEEAQKYVFLAKKYTDQSGKLFEEIRADSKTVADEVMDSITEELRSGKAPNLDEIRAKFEEQKGKALELKQRHRFTRLKVDELQTKAEILGKLAWTICHDKLGHQILLNDSPGLTLTKGWKLYNVASTSRSEILNSLFADLDGATVINLGRVETRRSGGILDVIKHLFD